MPKSPYPHTTQLSLFEKACAPLKLEVKGATMPYTSHNGHMFSFLDKEGKLSLRLSEENKAEFLKKYKTKPSVQHGVVMKEYMLVPDGLLKKTKELSGWIKKSLEYVKGLKPKK